MSLAAQEQALFELLFDEGLRARFAAGGAPVLRDRGLDEDALADFATLRADALELDARMRRSMVLSQLCVSFPLSFAIVASIPEGTALLEALVDVRTMRTPAVERTAVFGRRLRGELDDEADDPVQAGFRAVLEAELGMAWTAASIRREMLDTGRAPTPPAALADDWAEVPLRAAAFVSAAVLPAPRATLREALCPVSDRELWRHLQQAPTAEACVAEAFRRPEPRLLVARAEIDRASRCDPTARHHTVELSDGFAPLLGHASGGYSVRQLLTGLEDSGAGPDLLAGVQAGFRELCAAGMLEPA